MTTLSTCGTVFLVMRLSPLGDCLCRAKAHCQRQAAVLFSGCLHRYGVWLRRRSVQPQVAFFCKASCTDYLHTVRPHTAQMGTVCSATTQRDTEVLSVSQYRGQMSAEEVSVIMWQLLQALKFLHSNNVWHR